MAAARGSAGRGSGGGLVLWRTGPIGVIRWRACDLIMRLPRSLASRSRTIRAPKGPGLLACQHQVGRGPTSRMPRPWRHLKKSPAAWRTSARNSRPAHREGCGARTRCGSARRTNLPIAGLGRSTASHHSRSTHPVELSVRCGLPGTRGRRPLLVLPLDGTAPRSRPARTRSSSSIKPGGMPPRRQGSDQHLSDAAVAAARPNSPRSSCGRTGSRIGTPCILGVQGALVQGMRQRARIVHDNWRPRKTG